MSMKKITIPYVVVHGASQTDTIGYYKIAGGFCNISIRQKHILISNIAKIGLPCKYQLPDQLTTDIGNI